MHPAITSILVPVDFSPCSIRALHVARALAQKLGASLHMLHIVEFRIVMPPGWGMEYFPTNFDDLQAEIVLDAKSRLQMYRNELEADGIPVTTTVLIGHAAGIIAERAGDIRADLLVMGTCGRSGVSHLLLGGVAERVMRTAPCPVLTVRDPLRRTDSAATPHAA